MKYNEHYYYFLLLDEMPARELCVYRPRKTGLNFGGDENMKTETMTAFEFFVTVHSTFLDEIRWYHPIFGLVSEYLGERFEEFFSDNCYPDWHSTEVMFEAIIKPENAKEYLMRRWKGKLSMEDYSAFLAEMECEEIEGCAEEVEGFMENLDETLAKVAEIGMPVMVLSSMKQMGFGSGGILLQGGF